MNKRGQMTIFIIAGVFVIGAILLLFVLKDSLNIDEDETLKLSAAADKLGFEIEGCLDEILREGLNVVALRK